MFHQLKYDNIKLPCHALIPLWHVFNRRLVNMEDEPKTNKAYGDIYLVTPNEDEAYEKAIAFAHVGVVGIIKEDDGFVCRVIQI